MKKRKNYTNIFKIPVFFYYWKCFIYVIIIIIISSSSSSSILVITFLKGIYNYIHENNYVSAVYSVAAVLYLQFVLHAMLFRAWNMFCTLH